MKSGVTGVVCSHVDKDTGVSVLKLIFNMYYRWIPHHRYGDMCLVQATAALQHCSSADCDNGINMVNF